MKFTHEDQVLFAKVALKIFDEEKDDVKNLGTLHAFGEIFKKHSDENNAMIFDVTEYLYEQLRLLRGDEGAINDIELRKVIEADIKSHES
jgi:hypothetical protein